MKKFILTMLTVVGFIHLSYGQDFATVKNTTKCELRIQFYYDNFDCTSPTVSLPFIIPAGGTFIVPVVSPDYRITGASVNRYISSIPIICPPTEFISPPPTCHTCPGPWPQTFTFPFDGDCCSQNVTGTWSEISCFGTTQETELIFN